MHDLSKLNDQQKQNLKIAFERHFKTYLLHTLYESYPSTSNEVEKNLKIETEIKRLNFGLFDKNVLQEIGAHISYQKYPSLFERSDIKEWVQDVCRICGLSVCNIESVKDYQPDARFVFVDISANHLDDYNMDFFKAALKTSKYGFLFLNNPDVFPWTDKRKTLLKNFLQETAPSHHQQNWPMVCLMNKQDPNLTFNFDFGIFEVQDDKFITKEKPAAEKDSKGFFKFVKGMFGSNEVIAPIMTAPSAKPIENVAAILEFLINFKKQKQLTLDSEFNSLIDSSIQQLKIINVRLGSTDIKKANPAFFFDCRRLITEDLPKTIEAYRLVSKEHDDIQQTARKLALENISNILNFISTTSREIAENDVKDLKTFNFYLKNKMGVENIEERSTSEIQASISQDTKALNIFGDDEAPDVSQQVKKNKL